MQRATENLNVSGVADGDPGCAQAYPGEELWKCITGVYRIPFLTTPHLVVAAQVLVADATLPPPSSSRVLLASVLPFA